MIPRLNELKDKYAGSGADLTDIYAHENEIEMFRKYPDYYGYVFYIMRLP